jgi:hypothetical protein
MGRIHRYGQLYDCLIFNFVATNTIEGKILQRLLEKLQEIRDALDDDAVFNVVGEVLPAAHVERVLRDYYAGRLGEADLEDRILRNVDEKQFKAICQTALEGLASKKLNLDMLIERRAKAQERRVVPETISRFMSGSVEYVPFTLKTIPSLPYTFEPIRMPTILRNYENQPDWRLPPLATKYPRFSTDRETAEKNNLEWVTPGHGLFEALRRHTLNAAQEPFSKGASFYSLQHDSPARMDVYRARVVDGLGQVIHERLFAIELGSTGFGSTGFQPVKEGQDPPPIQLKLVDPSILGNFLPTDTPETLPSVATLPEAIEWLNENGLMPFLSEVRNERLSELDRIAAHIELSLTELLQKADEEIGKLASEVERKAAGAEGRLAQAESRHAELLSRREKRRLELDRQRALTLQAVERVTSVLILPHPKRKSAEVRRLQPDSEVEAVAMQVAMEYEKEKDRQVHDVHEKNFGYDLTSLDFNSGELRLIEVKGIGESAGNVLLTPNEKRVAEDRRDCYWLYVVTDCKKEPQLQNPIKDPARLQWHEVKKVDHYYLSIDAVTQPMQVREEVIPFGDQKK